MKEFVKMMNDLKISQTSIDWIEDIPEGVFTKHFYNTGEGRFYKILENELDVDKHRWYELSTTVVQIPKGLFGIRHISQLYAETSSCDDICHTLEFFEVEEIIIVTYKRKE